MNILAIGTSNTIIGRNGYLKSLSINHDVRNLSLGRAPFFMHITTILNNIDLINYSDILIIDHLSNPGFINSFQYDSYLIEFYNMLSALNIHVVILCLPHKSKDPVFIQHRKQAEALALIRNLTFIDFKDEFVQDELFDDLQHINIFPSYIFGEWLSDVFQSLSDISRPSGGSFEGFKFIKPQYSGEKFKNSLIEREYCEIDNSVTFNVTGTLVSLEYVSNGLNRFSLNNQNFHVYDTKGVFHDSFRTEIYCDGYLTIQRCNNEDSISITPSKNKYLEVDNCSLKLVGMLIADEFVHNPCNRRHIIDFDLNKLKTKLNDYSILVDKLRANW